MLFETQKYAVEAKVGGSYRNHLAINFEL